MLNAKFFLSVMAQGPGLVAGLVQVWCVLYIDNIRSIVYVVHALVLCPINHVFESCSEQWLKAPLFVFQSNIWVPPAS
jgi:hypothetical protein